MARICVFREKDRQFVSELIAARLVDRDLIAARLSAVPERYAAAAANAVAWLLAL